MGDGRHQPGQALVHDGHRALPHPLRLLRIAEVQALVDGLQPAAQRAQPSRQLRDRIRELMIDGGEHEEQDGHQGQEREERDHAHRHRPRMDPPPGPLERALEGGGGRVQEVGEGEGDGEGGQDLAHRLQRAQEQHDGGDGQQGADPWVAQHALPHAGLTRGRSGRGRWRRGTRSGGRRRR